MIEKHLLLLVYVTFPLLPRERKLCDCALSLSIVQTNWYVSIWLIEQLWILSGEWPMIMQRLNEQVGGCCSDHTDNHTGWMGRPDRQSISDEHFDFIYMCTDCPWLCSCHNLWNLALPQMKVQLWKEYSVRLRVMRTVFQYQIFP